MSIDNPELHKEPYQFKNPYAKRFAEEFAHLPWTEELREEFDKKADEKTEGLNPNKSGDEKYKEIRSELIHTNNMFTWYRGFKSRVEMRSNKTKREKIKESSLGDRENAYEPYSTLRLDTSPRQVVEDIEESFRRLLEPDFLAQLEKLNNRQGPAPENLFETLLPVYFDLRTKGYSRLDAVG